ncbi:hypothetical protein ARMGADRAFT_1017587 [Armillaria gallica]|uniref:Alpha/beta-hydrolase n=1 Tax=Armillaria gallica TaxID=47427 RepID=A0A2H3CXG7_ARMGA|nr:hypothetical protein ARMGADRAFT_1017587 [Armillaria gallica]
MYRPQQHTAYIKLISAPTFDTYTKWTKKIGLSPTIEDLPDGAKLFWIGKKRVDKVLLYVHGGAYLFGCGPLFMQFFRYLQLELEKRNTSLSYAHHYSTPLPKIPFPWALLISPWACLAGDKSFKINDPYDLISGRTYRSWGNIILQHADTQLVDPVGFGAPKNWFNGIHEFVGKVLVTSGAKECMYTAHERLVQEYLKITDLDVEFVVTDGARGVHDDMLFDFSIPREKTENLSPTTAVIVDWCMGLFGQ